MKKKTMTTQELIAQRRPTMRDWRRVMFTKKELRGMKGDPQKILRELRGR